LGRRALVLSANWPVWAQPHVARSPRRGPATVGGHQVRGRGGPAGPGAHIFPSGCNQVRAEPYCTALRGNVRPPRRCPARRDHRAVGVVRSIRLRRGAPGTGQLSASASSSSVNSRYRKAPSTLAANNGNRGEVHSFTAAKTGSTTIRAASVDGAGECARCLTRLWSGSVAPGPAPAARVTWRRPVCSISRQQRSWRIWCRSR